LRKKVPKGKPEEREKKAGGGKNLKLSFDGHLYERDGPERVTYQRRREKENQKSLTAK